MGVINQPFVSQDLDTLRWKGQCTGAFLTWGPIPIPSASHLYKKQQWKAGPIDPKPQLWMLPPVLSSHSYQWKGDRQGWALSRVCGKCIFQAAGAGYKNLCVFLGPVDIYIFSEDTKSRWYSCAAHAIFGAMGGGMVDLKECLERSTDVGLDLPQLVYHVGDEDAAGVDQWANKGGLITYRSKQQLETFLSLLLQHLAAMDTHT